MSALVTVVASFPAASVETNVKLSPAPSVSEPSKIRVRVAVVSLTTLVVVAFPPIVPVTVVPESTVAVIVTVSPTFAKVGFALLEVI